MALRVNATMTFTSYEVVDDTIRFHFVSPDPGAGEASDYYVTMTDAELAATNTQVQLRAALTTKLGRKLRATGIATRLDALIGQSLTV